jgi:hypothetical protein
MPNKKDERLMKEAVDEAEGNLSSEHSLRTTSTGSVAMPGQFKGMGIAGLENIPASMVSIPYCRLVQPTSKNTTLANGKDAMPGNFMFNDIQKEVGELNFVMFQARVDLKLVDENGNFVSPDYKGNTNKKQVLSILGITTDTNKLFILSLSVTSFTTWGKLMAQFKEINLDKSWRFEINATSEKRENDKGKYYVVNFKIGDELKGERLAEMEKTAHEYGAVLDREAPVEEV